MRLGPYRLTAAITALAFIGTCSALAAQRKKKEKEEVTQVLELPKDPPQAVVADASRLVFHVSPLSNRGLLSQQVRDALKALFGQVRGAQIVKLRAFVAGSGDVRRVQAIVSEVFTDRRLSIPALTVVQVGALPLEGAQVVLESISVDKKEANPNGLALISGVRGTAKEAAAVVGKAAAAAGAGLEAVRQITCYLDSIERVNDLRPAVAAAFRKAAATYVQIRRDSSGENTVCEAIAALSSPPDRSPSFIGAEGEYAQAALVGPVRLALTGTQLAFGREDTDVQLAFDRLRKALESVGANWNTVAALDSYPLFAAMAEKASSTGRRLFAPHRPPAHTTHIFEGLPSLDALLAVDAVAVVNQ